MRNIIEKIPKKYLNPELYRWDIINHLIQINNYTSYLEIGVQHGECFKRIRCDIKHSVDPFHRSTFQMKSDDFFKSNERKYDIIFIDGDHTEGQAYTDIKNSLSILSQNGTIVVHDCLPCCEDIQIVPRETKQWTGDVWKGIIRARHDFEFHLDVIDTDFGVGIITKKQSKTPEIPQELTYHNFEKNKHVWLNIIDVSGFNKIYNRLQ